MRWLILLMMAGLMHGCAIYSVADAAVSVTADVVSTGVHVVTGVVDTAVDVVTPSRSKNK
jgi:hypothetical protein